MTKCPAKHFFFSNAGTIESCPSSPLFIPAKPVKKSTRMRKHIKEGGGGSTDSEEHAVAEIKEASKKKRRKGQTNQKESKGKTAGNSRGEAGQDSKGSEVSQRSTVTEKCNDQAPSARQAQKQQKTARDATAQQTEQLQPNKTSKVLGEQRLTHCIWFHSCKKRWKKIVESKIFHTFKWRCGGPSIQPHVVFRFNIVCGGKKWERTSLSFQRFIAG